MESRFYTYRTSQFRLATFQLLSSHEWLTDTLLDSQVWSSSLWAPTQQSPIILLLQTRMSGSQCCF